MKTLMKLTALLLLVGSTTAATAERLVSSDSLQQPQTAFGLSKFKNSVSNSPSKTGSINVPKTVAVSASMLLACTSGMVNGLCLSGIVKGVKQATTAVTGSVTNSAVGLHLDTMSTSVVNTKYLLSYIGGSTIAGLIHPDPKAFEIRQPFNLSIAFLLAAGLLLKACKEATKGDKSFVLFALAASGIQNSLTSTLTANLCRTSHYTGISSDIGTFLGQVLRGNTDNLAKLKVFCLLIGSFWLGAFLSVPLGNRLSANTFLVAASMYMMMALSVYSVSLSKKSTKLL